MGKSDSATDEASASTYDLDDSQHGLLDLHAIRCGQCPTS